MTGALADGDYTAAVSLTGGSGRATVRSPATLHVEDGEIQAEIVWSSGSYDYMEVAGTAYYPVNTGGNSTFLVAIPGLDEEIPVVAETVAMSTPHKIEYTLWFDGDSLQTGPFPFAAVLIPVAVAAAALAALIAVILKKRKKSHEKKN